MTFSRLDSPVQFLKGVGPRRAESLARLGILKARDLLYHVPRRYEDASSVQPVADLQVGDAAVVVGRVRSSGVIPTRKGLRIFQAVIEDHTGHITCAWPGQPWLDRKIHKGDILLASGTVRFFHGRQIQPREFAILESGRARRAAASEGEVAPDQGTIFVVYPASEAVPQWVLRQLIEPQPGHAPAAGGRGRAHVPGGAPGDRRAGARQGAFEHARAPESRPDGAGPAAPRLRRALLPAAHARPHPVPEHHLRRRHPVSPHQPAHPAPSRIAGIPPHRGADPGASRDLCGHDRGLPHEPHAAGGTWGRGRPSSPSSPCCSRWKGATRPPSWPPPSCSPNSTRAACSVCSARSASRPCCLPGVPMRSSGPACSPPSPTAPDLW